MSEPTDLADEDLVPQVWTVYFYYSVNDELLYLGMTGNGPQRGKQHSQTAIWWHLATRAEFEHFRTLEDAVVAERTYIADLDPIFNVRDALPDAARTGLRPHPPKGGGVPQAHDSGSSPRSPEFSSTELAADGVSKLWDGYVNERDASLRRRWGLKLDQWEAIRDAGDAHGGCAGCGRRNARLVVDDDHDTGELCGALCDPCNRKLTERLRRYVQNPPSRKVAERLGIRGFFLPVSRREAFERSRQKRNARQNVKRAEQRTRRKEISSTLEQLRAMTKQGD